MNLIEQLGGYEKSKNLFSLFKHSISFKYYPRPVDDLSNFVDVSVVDLKLALLDYRHQHGIFEKGDFVVYRKQCSLIWDGVYRVDAVLVDGRVIERDLPTAKEWLSHATPEEIAAGHRID